MKPKVIWLTGLSGAGKSSIATSLSSALRYKSLPCTILDGDILRSGLNYDLQFSESDRSESVRRTAEVAKIILDSDITVIVALISPFKNDRQFARSLFKSGEFIEVYLNTPIELCIKCDVKGLYNKELRGEIGNFTGISSPYETPENPEITVDTQMHTLSEITNLLLDRLKKP